MGTARTAVRASGVRVVALISTTLVSFAMMPFLVHSLGDRVYGFWALVGALVGYYGLLDLGIVSAVQFHVAKAAGTNDSAAATCAISTAFYAFAALGLAVALLAAAVALMTPRFVHSESEAVLLRKVVLITGFGVALGFPGRAFVGALSAFLRWDLISGVSLGVLAVRTALIVTAIKAGGGIVGLAAITVSAEVATYLCYYGILRYRYRWFQLSPSYVSVRSLKEIFWYSRFTALINISKQLKYYVAALIVSAVLSVNAVTHYVIASRLALSYRDLMVAVFGILSPVFSRLLGNREYAQMRQVYEVTTKLTAGAGTVIVCIIVFYGRAVIELWMGKGYLDAYWPLVLLAGSVFFENSQLPAVNYMYGVSKHHFLAYISLIEGASVLALSMWLGKTYGMMGVALGAAIPMFIVWLLVQPIYVCRQMGIGAGVFYRRLFGRTSGAVGAVMCLSWFLLFQKMTRTAWVPLAMSVGCHTLIGFGAILFWGLGRNERASLIHALIPAAAGRAVTGTTAGTHTRKVPTLASEEQ